MITIARAQAACVLAQIVLSPALWLGDGWIAPLPLFETPMETAWTHAMTAALAAFALLVLAGVRPKLVLPIYAALWIARAAPDRALWQTYALEHAAIAIVLAWASRGEHRQAQALGAIRWMLGFVFAWAGLYKLNPSFLENGLNFLVAVPPWVNAAAAIVEALLGAALLVPRTQRIAAIVLAASSIVMALVLSARGLNRAVVPWNLEHAVILTLLALRPDRALRVSTLHFAVIVVFGILPSTYPLGWPPYLALRLYTASSPDARLYLDDVDALPAPARSVAARDSSGVFAASLDLETWAHEASGAFVPPDNASFTAMLHRVCDRVDDRTRVLLVVREPTEFWREGRTSYLRCE